MLKRCFLSLCALVGIWGSATSIGLAQPYEGLGRCGYLPGVWMWFSGNRTYFYPDGTVQGGGNVTATWTCARGTAVITWSHGFIDTVTISPGGQHLSGFNQNGGHIWGRRIGDL